jgi:restriction system protein
MTPSEFEELVAGDFRRRGYEVENRPDANDWGVDLIAVNGAERVAVQVKMYGGTTRPVNRAMVMELFGAAAFFDCTTAVIATDGRVMADARDVARKLHIAVLEFGEGGPSTAQTRDEVSKAAGGSPPTFESVWTTYIVPLQGQTLARANGETNRIMKVDWSGIERITSTGRRQHIKIEIFKLVVNRVLLCGAITREQINELYPGRASSGVSLILAQVPIFEYSGRPAVLRLRK